jgi:hypothetical protein
MSERLERFIAVDWSGAVDSVAQRKSIWIADWRGGTLWQFKSGISRDRTIAYIEAAGRETSNLVVGLDFAFSYPAWFLEQQGCSTASAFWQLVAEGKGKEWLQEPNELFWGHGKRPLSYVAKQAFRITEMSLMNELGGNMKPKSGFQINGAGSVGKGSLRGIPYLFRLHQAGFRIWPFDPPGYPAVVEIYPRIFTGSTVTSKCSSRTAHLTQRQYGSLSDEDRNKAIDSEHAFDALCSVIGMKDHADELANLNEETDSNFKLEGRIWRPSAGGLGSSFSSR